MTRRSLTALSLFALAAAPLSAQSAAKNDDPDVKAAGGALPAGWTGRADRANAKLQDAKFVRMGTGFHVTSGPAAIYWRPTDRVSVPFKATATFTQMKAPTHPEAYGIFYMGGKLESPQQEYAYLLVRGDGKVMVKHRAGAELHTIMDWTENAAVKKADASGKATNTLSVDARPDSTRLLVNDVQVAAIGGSYAKADGVVGLRVNHNLDVHVEGFTLSRGAKGKAPAKRAAKRP